ncbi:MAG: hypothetical protein Q27BPR15_00130 [Rhodobacter sp. CACIA14H1]|nr:MAG: hypothetical protein Q27BPR15_00130 [Rhodobacter sp. CACIA14H1]
MQTGMTCLDIAILDRNPLLADGMAALLERQHGTRAVALRVTGTLEPEDPVSGPFDILVLDPADFALPVPAMVAQLRALSGGARMIGYSASDSSALARACLAEGFRAFLSKTASLDALQTAIAAVQSGALYLDPRYADAILATPSVTSPPPAPARGLTEREAYVLKSVARGKSLKEIGYELALSSKTVETYKARGTSKLNISGRREIVEYAIRSGWV